MLNDLFSIERGMAAYGVGFVTQHPDIKDMARGGAFHVRLDADGRIDALGFIAESDRGALWTLRDGQHNGFPGLKTAAGLLSLDAASRTAHGKIWDGDKSPIARRNELTRLLHAHALDEAKAGGWPSASHRKRIAERLGQLTPLRDDPLAAAVPAAFERFLRALNSSPMFLRNVLDELKYRVENSGDEWLAFAREALLGSIALMIDVAEDDFERDAIDIRQIGPISKILLGRANNAGDGEGRCALTGDMVRLHAGNFPQPNLPGLGQTYIFSRNDDIPSLTRYGRSADASFAVGAEFVCRLSGAIAYLAEDKKRRYSWRFIPAEAGKEADLLIVCRVKTPDAPLADALADDASGYFVAEMDDEDDEADFDERTSSIIAQSLGVYKHARIGADVMLLVLRAVDPANRKAVYQIGMSAAEFHEAAKNWRLRATRNAPSWFGFYMPSSSKPRAEMAGLRKPSYVAPLSLTPLSRMKFVEGGRRRIDVIGLPATVAFALFLRRGDVRSRARDALRLLLKRHKALLSGIAQANRKGREHLKNFDPKLDLRLDALRSVTWLGALLYRLGRAREVYMSDAAFRLGQLLAAADVVHIGYCMDVRGGSIPATLLGNALLSQASADPYKALKLLLKRWRPYSAWVINGGDIMAKADDQLKKAGKKPDEQRRAKDRAIALRRAVGQSSRVGPIAACLCDQLRQVKLPTDDRFQAELLLGYLAGLPPAPKKEGVDEEDNAEQDLHDQNERD